jgi:hypothetical protein
MTEVHAGPVIVEVQRLYRDAPVSLFTHTNQIVDSHSQILFDAHQNQLPVCSFQISNWHPELVSKSAEFILAADFTIDDARLAISREFGYENYEAANTNARPIDQKFEAAVDFALAGHIAQLKSALAESPGLVTQASAFGHCATLLIYLAANGVETWRQVVPSNVVKVAELLISAGADKRATASVYGGQFDALALAETSAHPHKAGVAKELSAVLR